MGKNQKAPGRKCADCGCGPAHHAVPGDPCWCPACLLKPEEERCTAWVEGLPAVERNVVRVGHKHPETAKQMQARALPRSGSLRAQALHMITLHRGLTDDELEDKLGRSHQSVSAVRNSLMNDGWIQDSGVRRQTRYGNDAIVWMRVVEDRNS